MILALLKNECYGKLISYQLWETVYDNEEDFLYYGCEVVQQVNSFKPEEFEEVLKNNNYDYLKTVNYLHYETVDRILLGF